MDAVEHGAPSRARTGIVCGALAHAMLLASVLPGCAEAMLVPSDAGSRLDATLAPRTVSVIPEGTPRADVAARMRPSTPAPPVASLRGPSGMPLASACPVTHPPGDCDRCPERACRQVRVPGRPGAPPAWAMFCDAGDVREEALIACLCASGDAPRCRRSASETAFALELIDRVFGGEVPPIGTRYRDGYGLRAVVDRELHDWLAAVAGPSPVPRCVAPDRHGSARLYEERAQRVRTTGSCAAAASE